MFKTFSHNFATCRSFTPSPVVLASLVKHKLFGSAVLRGSYRENAFAYRVADVGAIKEVLVDNEYDFLRQDVSGRDGLMVLDLGHHIGTFSLWLTSLNPSARVLGVEADPDTFEMASRNAKMGRKRGVQWDVIHRAAWENDDVLSFSVSGQTMGHKVSPTGSVQVQGIDLKPLLDRLGGQVDILKIDIEGAEGRFLSHVAPLLKRVASLVIEIHPRECSEPAVMEILRGAFPVVRRMGRELSSKPLMWCTR